MQVGLNSSPKLIALLEEGAIQDGHPIPAAADGKGQALLQPRQRVLVQNEGPAVGKGDACQVSGHPAVVEDEVIMLPVLVLQKQISLNRTLDVCSFQIISAGL